MTGFGRLKIPSDLFKKLQHDHERILRAPADEYAAFDFFVTAEHIVDWLYPGDANRPTRKGVRDSDERLLITWDIASGGKHFLVEGRGHHSVETSFVSGAFDPGAFDPGGFNTADSLVVVLENGTRLGVLQLASDVLGYWRDYFASHPEQ